MRADRLRILFAHNRYLVPGGEDRSTRSEIEMLRKAGHVADLWEVSNERISEIGAARAGLSAVWARQACAELATRLDRNRYDILHVQNHFPLLSPAIHRVAAKRGVATVQHLRNFRMMCVNAAFFRHGADCQRCRHDFAPWRGVLSACYRGSVGASLAPAASVAAHKLLGTWSRHVDAYVAVSSYVRDAHRDAGFPADRIHVRGNLVGRPGRPPQRARTPTIVAPARLSPEKGLDVLIRAWRRRPHAAGLHIAGSGDEEAALRNLAEGAPTIRFEGQMSFADLLDLMATARAVVSPSLNMEPFGRVPMEAFSVGTPAIVSRAGGLADIVTHQKDGLLVDPGDVEALDEALGVMLTNDAAQARMARAAAETFAERFSPAVMLPATEAIYEAALARRKQIAETSKPPRQAVKRRVPERSSGHLR